MLSAKTGAMVEELIGKARVAMAEYLNETAAEIFDQSQKEVPKSLDHQPRPNDPNYPEESLEETGRVSEATAAQPRNALGQFATYAEEDMVATIEYDSPYAAAQHEGEMTYERNGKTIEWKATNYTTPGTKKKYLEDPLKAAMADGSAKLAGFSRVAFDG